MNKLSKEQEERFDAHWWHDIEGQDEPNKSQFKQHLADALARERKRIIESLERSRKFHKAVVARTRSITSKGLHAYAIQELDGVIKMINDK